jgi:uncharacterized protein YkwD
MGSDDRYAEENMSMSSNPVQKMISIAMLCALFMFFCVLSPSPIYSGSLKKRPRPTVSAASLEKRIHALINKERRKQGLSQLGWDDSLARIGRKHSQDMAARNYFDHYSPEGHGFTYRYQKERYQCAIRVGSTIHQGAENIALNHLYDSVTTVNNDAFYDWNSEERIAETTVRGWMESKGHRKNILTPHWKHEGIGVFIAPDDKVYITQNFC